MFVLVNRTGISREEERGSDIPNIIAYSCSFLVRARAMVDVANVH
jgi:hypothetical protein